MQHYPGPWTPDIVPTLVSTAHYPGAGHSLLTHAVDVSGATQTISTMINCRLLLLMRLDHLPRQARDKRKEGNRYVLFLEHRAIFRTPLRHRKTHQQLTALSTGAAVGSLCTAEQRGAAAAAGCSPFAGGWSAKGSVGTTAGASPSNSSLLLPLPKITAGSDRSTAVPTHAIELVRRSKREKNGSRFDLGHCYCGKR